MAHPLTDFLNEKFPNVREDIRNLTVNKYKALYDDAVKAVKANRKDRKGTAYKNARNNVEQVKGVALRAVASCIATLKILETAGKQMTTEELKSAIFDLK